MLRGKKIVNLVNKTIAQVLPSLESGGVERGTIDLAIALKRLCKQPIVISRGGKLVKILERNDILHIQAPVHEKNPVSIWQNKCFLQKIIEHHKIDLIHARSRAPAWSAYFACKNKNIPFLTTFHGTYNFTNNLKRAYNSVMVKGNHVIANSDFIRQHIIDHYRDYVSPNNITTVQRGVDLDVFNPEKISLNDIERFKENWGIKKGVPVVMMIGRLTRWKGQKVLIQALKQMAEHSFQCFIVGSDQGRTAYKEELEQEIQTASLENKIFLKDHCDDIPTALLTADVVVHASTDPEAFGRTVAEAQAMGKPVITNTLGAPREIVIKDETGWVIEPNDPEDLARAIQQVLTFNNQKREEIAHNAREKIIKSFSLQQMCDNTALIYEMLLKDKDPQNVT